MYIRVFAALATALALVVGAAAAAPVETPETAIDVTVRVNDSAPATQLGHQLPRTLSFTNRMGTALAALLPTALDAAGRKSAAGYHAGDVAYWAPNHSIVVFLFDGAGVPAEGLTLVGHITHGMNALSDCTRDCSVHLLER